MLEQISRIDVVSTAGSLRRHYGAELFKLVE